MAFILFLSFLDLSHSAACPIYACKNSVTFPTASTCSLYDALLNTYYINPCKSSYSCSLPSVSTTQCAYDSTYTANTQVSGSKCIFDQDCTLNNVCLNERCVGLSKNSTCTSHLDCNVGLYCNKKNICTPQIQIGHTGCLEDANCVNSAGCQTYSLTNSSMNICTSYFSLADYTSILACSTSGDVNYLCESGFCVNIGTSICYPAPKLTKASPVICNTNADCVSTATGKLGLVFNSNCACGRNTKGNQICSVMPGDEIYNNYDSMVRDWTESSGIKKCNTMGRFGYSCMQTYWESDFKEFYKKEILALYYQWIVDTEACVLETYFNEYYHSLDLAVLIHIGSLAMAIVIV